MISRYKGLLKNWFIDRTYLDHDQSCPSAVRRLDLSQLTRVPVLSESIETRVLTTDDQSGPDLIMSKSVTQNLINKTEIP